MLLIVNVIQANSMQMAYFQIQLLLFLFNSIQNKVIITVIAQ